jgi:hypothetical protein
MAQFQSWSQGWEKAGDEAENKRAKMLEAFNKFKQENPDATAAEFQEYVSNVMGNKPWLRGALPAEEVLNKLGARNEERAAFKRRDDMFARAKEKAGIESSLRTMIEEDMLSYDPKDIESGKAVEDFASNHPEMFSSIGGGEPLFREGMISRYLNMPNYKRKSAKWFNDNQNSLTDFLKNNPTGDAATYAFNQEVPLHLVQGQFDQAKEEYTIKKMDKARADKRLVVSALKEDDMLKRAFAHAPTGDAGRKALGNSLKEYYTGRDGEYENFLKANPDFIDQLEGQMLARRDDAIESTNKTARDALGTKKEALMADVRKRNVADSEGYFGKLGESFEVYGETGHAVSSYMAKIARDYVIDTDTVGMLDRAFHEAKKKGIKGLKELDTFMREKNIQLKPIDGIAARDAFVNTKMPKFQTAAQWRTQTVNDIRGDREGLEKAINAIDTKAYSNPKQALHEYEVFLSSLNRRYPVGENGLENVFGSVAREIQEDVDNWHTWQQGGESYAAEEYKGEVSNELKTTLAEISRMKSHIANNVQKLKEVINSSPKFVSNTDGNPYPAPPRAAPIRTGR